MEFKGIRDDLVRKKSTKRIEKKRKSKVLIWYYRWDIVNPQRKFTYRKFRICEQSKHKWLPYKDYCIRCGCPGLYAVQITSKKSLFVQLAGR